MLINVEIVVERHDKNEDVEEIKRERT